MIAALDRPLGGAALTTSVVLFVMPVGSRRVATIAVASIALLLLALFSLLASAQTRRPSQRAHCPRHRVESGTTCRTENQQCSWSCGQEGDHDRSCVCVKTIDNRTAWECTQGPLCGL